MTVLLKPYISVSFGSVGHYRTKSMFQLLIPRMLWRTELFKLCVRAAGDNTLKASSGRFKSIQVDVTGRPRRTKVRLPASILGSKPVSVPKQQVREHSRSVKTTASTRSLYIREMCSMSEQSITHHCLRPHFQFLTVEEPVRRRCRTTSLTNPEVVTRGFELFPSSVDFGTLQEGSFSAIAVTMKNVGVDTCR